MIEDEALALGDNPLRQMPTFSSIRALVDGDGQFVLTRPSKYELLVEKLEGFSSMRTKPFAFKVGDQFEWSNFRVEVLATNSRDEATRIKYQLSDELITAGKIMSWDKNQFVADTLPAVGESRIIQVKGPL